MDCTKIRETLVDYVDNQLDKELHKEVEKHLESCEACQQELSELTEMLAIMKKDTIMMPSPNLKLRFEQALEEEKQGAKVITLPKRKLPTTFLKYAAGVAILVSAFMLGKFQQEGAIQALEVESRSNKQATMLALMENESASKRIQGVHYIEEFSDPDPEIVNALVKRMLNDDNANVRLTAVVALEAFISAETVKDGFIQALETEKDPSIQISIIKALVKIQEKKALKPMQKLLEKEDTQLFVKDEIKTVLTNI